MGLFSFLRKSKQGADSDDDFDEPVKPRRTRRSQAADSQDPVDPVLPEKKRARRRLIGATALVLAAIIGLPMIFDSEPKPLADDIAIQIPSRDKPVQSMAAATVALPLPPEPEPAADTAKAGEPAPATAAVPVKPEPKVESKPEAKAEPKPVARSDDASTPAAVAAPAKEKSTRFIVQVAAIATKEHANDLQARLKKAGIKSYSQKVSTKAGERIRIRIGPFNTKEEADKMRARLVKLGLNGALLPA
jgi:DedD protein